MEEIREVEKSKMIDLVLVSITIFMILLSGMYLAGCSYTINMVPSGGNANDVIDQSASNTPTVSAALRPSLIP